MVPQSPQIQQQIQLVTAPTASQDSSKSGLPPLNNLYKTQLCKHFMMTKHCHVGNKCHFAHGENELRKKDEALPVDIQMKMLNIPYNNFKTQKCKYFYGTETPGLCKFGKNCSYAHGEQDVRNPYKNVDLEQLVQDHYGVGGYDPEAKTLILPKPPIPTTGGSKKGGHPQQQQELPPLATGILTFQIDPRLLTNPELSQGQFIQIAAPALMNTASLSHPQMTLVQQQPQYMAQQQPQQPATMVQAQVIGQLSSKNTCIAQVQSLQIKKTQQNLQTQTAAVASQIQGPIYQSSPIQMHEQMVPHPHPQQQYLQMHHHPQSGLHMYEQQQQPTGYYHSTGGIQPQQSYMVPQGHDPRNYYPQTIMINQRYAQAPQGYISHNHPSAGPPQHYQQHHITLSPQHQANTSWGQPPQGSLSNNGQGFNYMLMSPDFDHHHDEMNGTSNNLEN